MQFVELGLSQPLLRALASEAYTTATPIQAQAIPHALAGRDVLGCAQTGTGKTAAFALPILQRLAGQSVAAGTPRRPRALILCPTRELATQIGDSFRVYGQNVNLTNTTIFGGVNQNPQVQTLRRGVDILIATPGRLLDLMNQRLVDLRAVETLVLDEADRMLDMGFINDIRRVVAALPERRQTLLFSATMPPEVRRLADTFLRNPATVQVTPVSSTVEAVDQSVYFVARSNKPALLAHLYGQLPMTRTIVFTRTKHGADRVVRQLHARGIRSEAIHGNKSQNARQRALDNFRASRTPVLVATDIASRGIDVDGITHVVNYDLTDEPETYVHRIGRTARAGASGVAVSFCDSEEVANLRAIEKLIRRPIRVRADHPEFSKEEQQRGTYASGRNEGRTYAQSSRSSNATAPARQHHHASPASSTTTARKPHPMQGGTPAQAGRRTSTQASHSRPSKFGGFNPVNRNAHRRTSGRKRTMRAF
jgi:ATP-dependent RNA helicase RhlE